MDKPGRLAFSGMVLVCVAFLAACGDSARLQFVAVAPISGEIYVSAAPAGAVRGADHKGVRQALEAPSTTGNSPEAAIAPVTATCGSLQYAATAIFSNGSTQNVSSTATWMSSNKSVATVSSTGLATGIGLGTTEISASSGGVSSSGETLAVDQLNSITLNPAAPNVPLGGTQSFMAIGSFTFAAGGSGSLDVSSQVTWGSTNTSVATIDSSGKATAAGLGTTTITAISCDGITVGKTTMTVGSPVATSLAVTPATITISAGTTTLFAAMEKLSDGTIQPLPVGTVVTWSSDTTSVATVDLNSGVALGVAVGTANIIASSNGLNPGSAVLTVQAAAARYAYIGNLSGNGTPPTGGPGSISGYSVDVANATFTPLSGSPFAASNPQQVLVHPSGDLLFYIDSGSSIQTDFVDSTTGALTRSNRPPSLAGTGGTNVGVIDPLGRFIYVIDDGTAPTNSPSFTPTIFGFSIAQTQTQSTNGVLTAIFGPTGYTDSTLKVPSWVMTDRAGKYLYVVNAVGNSVSEYGIDQSTGALTPLSTATIPTGSSPNYATTDVKGHIYVANSGDGTVSVFSIDSTTGVLSQVGSTNFPVTGANTVFNVLTDPTGKFLYILDSPGTTPGHVFAFNLDQTTGAITTPIGTTPPAAGVGSIGMAIDPTGALLAVDNNVDFTISLYKVSTSNGVLTVATPATVATDQVPQFVTFYTAASGQ